MWNDFRHYKIALLSTKFKFSRNYFEIAWKSQFLIIDSSRFVQTFAQFWPKIVQNCYFWDIDSNHFQNRFRFPTLESSTRFPNPILDALHSSRAHKILLPKCLQANNRIKLDPIIILSGWSNEVRRGKELAKDCKYLMHLII